MFQNILYGVNKLRSIKADLSQCHKVGKSTEEDIMGTQQAQMNAL